MYSISELKTSHRDGKKMMVVLIEKETGKTKTIHFGNSDYRDFLILEKSKDPNRNEVRKNYLTRSAGIRDGSGNLTKDNPLSANYWARRVLWKSNEPYYGIK